MKTCKNSLHVLIKGTVSVVWPRVVIKLLNYKNVCLSYLKGTQHEIGSEKLKVDGKSVFKGICSKLIKLNYPM